MSKTTAQRVRATEQRKREAGLVQIKAWVPDTPEARRALHERAAELRQEHAAKTADRDPSV
jgi:hypothetical protein